MSQDPQCQRASWLLAVRVGPLIIIRKQRRTAGAMQGGGTAIALYGAGGTCRGRAVPSPAARVSGGTVPPLSCELSQAGWSVCGRCAWVKPGDMTCCNFILILAPAACSTADPQRSTKRLQATCQAASARPAQAPTRHPKTVYPAPPPAPVCPPPPMHTSVYGAMPPKELGGRYAARCGFLQGTQRQQCGP